VTADVIRRPTPSHLAVAALIPGACSASHERTEPSRQKARSKQGSAPIEVRSSSRLVPRNSSSIAVAVLELDAPGLAEHLRPSLAAVLLRRLLGVPLGDPSPCLLEPDPTILRASSAASCSTRTMPVSGQAKAPSGAMPFTIRSPTEQSGRTAAIACR
jgi:hypothetical protein